MEINVPNISGIAHSGNVCLGGMAIPWRRNTDDRVTPNRRRPRRTMLIVQQFYFTARAAESQSRQRRLSLMRPATILISLNLRLWISRHRMNLIAILILRIDPTC